MGIAKLWPFAVLILAGLPCARGGLEPREQPSSSDDLRVSGLFQSTGVGEKFIPRSALLGVPGVVHIHEKPADLIPSADLTVLPIDKLLLRLPLASGADGIVLICSDRWESCMTVAFVKENHPYLMLKYAGRTPAEGWPRFSPIEGLAPYYANWSPALGPKAPKVTEYGEFDATQIVEIRAVNIKNRYAPFYAGELGSLSLKGSEGRKIFIRECNNCHQGPGGVGGNTSQRPFTLLQVHASLNTAYFRTFVRNPKKFYPQTVMPTHDYFTEDMMAQLIAFLSEARAAGVN